MVAPCTWSRENSLIPGRRADFLKEEMAQLRTISILGRQERTRKGLEVRE